MRILVCNWKDLTHPAAGGAEVYVDAVARRWVALGHEVTLFCSRTPDQAASGEVGGVRVVRCGGRFGVYREACRWYRAQEHRRFDIVLDVVNTRPFLTPRYVADAPVVALIFQVAREIWRYEVPRPAAALGRHWLEPRWLRLYANVPTLTISESSRQSLLAYGLRNVTIVPVGLELARPADRPPKEATPTIVFLGRLAANKRPDHALRAFRSAQAAMTAAQMWVVGAGPMEMSLRKEFTSDAIQFFGRVPDGKKLELLARAHAVVVTSVREGWGLVVTEAAAVGTPAIGYDVPGLRDSLRASGGLAVTPSVPAMAAAIASVLPRWAAGDSPDVKPGGVAPWAEVADEILGHLEHERSRAGH